MGHATQDYPKKRGLVKSSHQMWPTGEGNGKPLLYSFLENPMNSMTRQKDMTLKYIEIETVSRHLNLSLVFREGVKVGDRNFGVVNTEKVLKPCCCC